MVTMYPPQYVDAVLFDMDGTLLNLSLIHI